MGLVAGTSPSPLVCADLYNCGCVVFFVIHVLHYGFLDTNLFCTHKLLWSPSNS